MKSMLVFVSVLALTACADIAVRPVYQDGKDTYKKGVRFMRPWPYLVVTKELDKNDKPVFKAEIRMLPDADPEGEYVIEWSAGWFGTVNPNFNLGDGWNLTGFNSKTESGTAALLTSIAAVATAAKGFVRTEEVPGTATTATEPIEPGLYRMVRADLNGGHGEPLWTWVPRKPAVFTFVSPSPSPK